MRAVWPRSYLDPFGRPCGFRLNGTVLCRRRGCGQSSFDPLPTGADAYLLSRFIHDWDHAAAIAILRRYAEAAGGEDCLRGRHEVLPRSPDPPSLLIRLAVG